MRWVTSSDIKNWAETKPKDCQQHLLLVVRQLIQATARASFLDMPVGDATAQHGLDGMVHCVSGNEFVPAGYSVWEIGTTRNAAGKADSDFQKRNAGDDPPDKKIYSYIQVSPRVWQNASDWARGRSEEGIWTEVRAINASILENWLESAPAMGAWLAKHLGLASRGCRALGSVWEEWAACEKFNLPLELLTVQRKGNAERLLRWTADDPNILYLRADSPAEGLAFVHAASSCWPKTDCEAFQARAVVVDDEEALRALMLNREGLFLVITEALQAMAPTVRESGPECVNENETLDVRI